MCQSRNKGIVSNLNETRQYDFQITVEMSVDTSDPLGHF